LFKILLQRRCEYGAASWPEAGLDHVQISIQDSERASADRIAGYEGAFARKCALAPPKSFISKSR